jgi:hypothetical protein
MPEAIAGNVSQFKLIDVLKLLTSEGKTGMLSLRKGNEKAEIYVDKGTLVHAISRAGMGAEAIFSIVTWTVGNFDFNPNVTTKERSIEKNTTSLLDETIQHLREWDQIKEIIPSQDLVFRLSSERAPDEIRLKHEEWSVLSQIDGKKRVRNISDELKMGEHETARILYKLFSAGLIEVGTEPQLKTKKIVDMGFLTYVEGKLAEIIGPVASVIIEEEIKDMSEERVGFPSEKVSLLVEKISSEIADDAQRIEFQKIALEAFRGI